MSHSNDTGSRVDYHEFIKSKVRLAQTWGFDIGEDVINPALKPHQQTTVRRSARGGRH
jgi:hypothetical protein